MILTLVSKKNYVFLLLSFLLSLNSCSDDEAINDNLTEDVLDEDGATDTGIEGDEVDQDEVTNCESVYFLNLDATMCNVDIESKLGTTSLYEESIIGTTRYITVNNIPPHFVGEFPTKGNPNTIKAIESNYEMTIEPVLSTEQISTEFWVSGVLFNGVGLEIQTAETFVNPDTEQANTDWNILALQNAIDLGLDCNNSHVQPSGQYHSHGLPISYADYLGIDGTEMVKIGYAADGFPIYYKYAYDNTGSLSVFESGYALKNGERGGDGISAPNGCYDGTYEQDYEFIGGTGLDECNGRTGKTPENDNEYYYLITENWPSAPICFSGTPNSSFSFKALE